MSQCESDRALIIEVIKLHSNSEFAFAHRIRRFFTRKGYITQKQRDALNKILNLAEADK